MLLYKMPPSAHSSRILEITLISAQDLAPLSQSMKAYAIAWVDPERKLSTGVDQTAFADPTWNEKLVFRVDDKFLNSEDAAIEVEIYAAAWVKDALIGHVRVLITDLFALRSYPETNANNSAMRVVSLHVRRPSGRPQGILNMGFALLDSTMRSLPLYAEPSPCSSADNCDNKEPVVITRTEKEPSNTPKILRSQSDRTDLNTDDMFRKSELGGPTTNGGHSPYNGGSMVNGASLCSDLGPSASIVAAAIAYGLYKPAETKKGANKSPKIEGINAEVERQRTELRPAPTMAKAGRRRSKEEDEEEEEGKFTCFGNVFGCEITISCGGSKKKYGKVKNNKVCHLSSIVDNYSQSYV